MDGEPLFPLAVKDATFVPPDAATYYLLSANGLFIERRTPVFTASVPVEGGIPGLRPHDAHLALHVPRLPRSLLERAVGFFRAVFGRWQGEGILIMFCRPPRNGEGWRFALDAPPQLIRGWYERGRFRAELRLDYKACEKPGPDYLRLGTIHSHGDVGPWHSAIDVHDELYDTGLHITAGYVDSPLPAFAAAFVVNRTRFKVPVDTILPPFRRARPAPESWMSRITVTCRSWNRAWEPRDASY